VSQLLTLARSEPGGPQERLAPTDLAEAARQAVAALVPLADSKSVRLTMEAKSGCTVEGDASALQILVRNLVDNAVRYTPAGGRVELTVTNQGGPIVLAVDDSGKGIPASERERVFDRFYRRANSEEAGLEDSGSGLGLAIVRSIAERHAASVQMTDSALGGLRVEVRFAPAVNPS
jgi:signal transduction histidine kinase